MDILLLASTPIPAYFVLGPLGILLIILVTLLAKSSPKSAPAVAQAPLLVQPEQMTTPTPEPIVAEVATPAVTPVPVDVAPASVAQVVPPVSSWKPAEQVAMPIVEQFVPVIAAEVSPASLAVEASVETPVEAAPPQEAILEVTPEAKPTF